MTHSTPGQQKVFYLIATSFIFILVVSIGFSSAIVYSMAQHQDRIHQIYTRSTALSNAEQDVQADLSRLHNVMLGALLDKDSATLKQKNLNMQGMDADLRHDFSLLNSEFQGNNEKISEINLQMDDWNNIRLQVINLMLRGHKDQALKLNLGAGSQIYVKLENSMGSVLMSAQKHVKALIEKAKLEDARIIRLYWWFLAGLIASSTLLGTMILRKIRIILEHDALTTRQLHESEERLKLALSSADIGTWDLDVPSWKVNFDPLWGKLLSYDKKQELPGDMTQWAGLIHPEDRERVLNVIHDHIAGNTSEYKAEYRIRSGSGALKWVVGQGKAVCRDNNGKALRVVGITLDITMKKQAEDRIWHLAHSDLLTGLPNRVSFYDRLGQSLAHAKRHNMKLAVLFLDLDSFKQVNDKHGHDVGDALLQEVSKRLKQAIRAEDTVARTGGDEFIFILNDIEQAQNAVTVADKVIHSLAEPFMITGNTCRIGCSIGISIFPDDGEYTETLVSHADDAMYRVKASGKNDYQFYNPSCSAATR